MLFCCLFLGGAPHQLSFCCCRDFVAVQFLFVCFYSLKSVIVLV